MVLRPASHGGKVRLKCRVRSSLGSSDRCSASPVLQLSAHLRAAFNVEQRSRDGDVTQHFHCNVHDVKKAAKAGSPNFYDAATICHSGSLPEPASMAIQLYVAVVIAISSTLQLKKEQ